MTAITTPFTSRFAQRTTYTENGVTSVIRDNSASIVHGYSSRTLLSDDNWKWKVANGVDATNNYSRSGYSGTSAQLLSETRGRMIIWGVTYHVSSEDFFSQMSVPFSSDIPHDPTLRDQALSRLKNRLNNDIEGFRALVPIAELRELRGSVRAAAESATTIVRALANARRTRGGSVAQWASDAWLQWSFGFKPLMNDVSEAANAVAAYVNRKDLRRQLSGSSRKTWFSQYSTSGITGPYYASLTQTDQLVHTLSYRYHGGYDLKIATGNDYGLLEHFGLEFKNIPSLVYNLTAFSWLLDYFTTVGAYLDDTFTLPDGSLKYLMLNTRYTVEATSNLTAVMSPSFPDIGLVNNSCRPGHVRFYSFDRTKLTSIPRRAVRFRTLDEIGLSGVNKLLNLISLLIR